MANITAKDEVGGPSGLRKTISSHNSLAHRTTWLRSDLRLRLPPLRQRLTLSNSDIIKIRRLNHG